MNNLSFYCRLSRFHFFLKSFFSSFILIFISSILLFSCKEPDEVGLDHITKQKLNVCFNDSVNITAYSSVDDSIKTNLTSVNLIGNIFDPVFGKTIASVFTQFQTPSANVNFGNNPVLDSVVLSLDYVGFYGDISKPLTLNVYEINDTMNYLNSYYAFSKKNVLPAKLGSKSFIPKPQDSIYVFDLISRKNMLFPPHLRISLDSSFGNKFLNADPAELANNSAFTDFFNGLYITADSASSGSSILYFDLYSSLSKITVFYHNDGDTAKYSYSFIVNPSCARFNSYNHFNYNSSDGNFKKQVLLKDTSLGNNTLYLQAMGGVKTKLVFPDLKNLIKDENIAVNKAELVLKPNISLNFDTANYKIPFQLALTRLTNDNKIIIPPDYYAGANYFGGTYNKAKNEYRFRISLYIQQLLNDNIVGDKCLYLIINNASANASRLVLFGPQSLPFPDNLRLEITYTKLGEKF